MDTIKVIPKRSEIAVEDTWATEDLFSSDEIWEQTLGTLQEDIGSFCRTPGRERPDAFSVFGERGAHSRKGVTSGRIYYAESR